MIHVTLIPLTEKQEHVLVVNMHYAVADGWSLGVLFKDISLAYNQLKRSNGKSTAMYTCMAFVSRGCCAHLHGSLWQRLLSASTCVLSAETAVRVCMALFARGCYVHLYGFHWQRLLCASAWVSLAEAVECIYMCLVGRGCCARLHGSLC